MTYLKFLMFALVLSFPAFAQIDTAGQHFYMFIYFVNTNDVAGARLALSNDGINWTKINNEAPILVPTLSSEHRMRDPNTYFDSTTGTFHLIWTTGWNQVTIGYTSTKDLRNWTANPQMSIPVGAVIPGCTNCWAPEIFYDDIKDSFMVYWSTNRGTGGYRTYYTMTKDFKTFSAPTKFFDPGYSVIDATLLKVAQGKYYLFFKDERENADAEAIAKNIHYVVGQTPQGRGAPAGFTAGKTDAMWSAVSPAITKFGCEGPSAIIINNQYWVYVDPYGVGTDPFSSTYRLVKSSDINTTTFPWPQGDVLKTSTGNFLYSHGSISEIPKAKVLQLLYGIADNTSYKASYTQALEKDITVTPPPKEVIKYPLGKPNRGCGTGVGLAFFPPILFKAWSLRSRRKKKS